MLSYRHAFHAGNDADVIKHITLCGLLDAMTRKDKPFLYLETHAGAGYYGLQSLRARETGESDRGVRLFKDLAPGALPHDAELWLERVRACNAGAGLRRYPGSPWLAKSFLRTQDRAVFAELHPVDHGKLTRLMRDSPRSTVVQQDGYELLRAFLPPVERRALVLIDPAYETRDELVRLHRALVEGLQRFATGVFAVWYPLGARHGAEAIVAHVARAARSTPRPVKTLDLRWERAVPQERGDGTIGLRGAGMVILNPPFGLEASLREALTAAALRLEPEAAGAGRGPRIDVSWPVPESA
jgi:23S rRNA (adenine2030-N6)-methyltransferase